jgi:hypothetical protein
VRKFQESRAGFAHRPLAWQHDGGEDPSAEKESARAGRLNIARLTLQPPLEMDHRRI